MTSWLSRHLFERGEFDTAPGADLHDFGIDDEGFGRYAPSGWFWLIRAMRGMEVGPEDVFVDYGSGKGRVVYQAARRYPFGRVIGVEIAEELNAMARANIARNRDRLACKNVELVTCDARMFDPPDEMTYAYFFHPFEPEVFRAVLDRIVASLDRRPRRLTLLYAFPVNDDVIYETGRFVLASERKGLRPDRFDRRIHVWVSDPATRP